MEGHARTWFTPKQKAELWERWKSGQCVADIGQHLPDNHFDCTSPWEPCGTFAT